MFFDRITDDLWSTYACLGKHFLYVKSLSELLDMMARCNMPCWMTALWSNGLCQTANAPQTALPQRPLYVCSLSNVFLRKHDDSTPNKHVKASIKL